MIGDGLLVIDKPSDWTSHDVVARMRRLAQTRKVGHAGTLDPMATGVLLLGVGRATKLLGHLALNDKKYSATIRLGQATTTDDAEGEPISSADASGLAHSQVAEVIASLTGEIRQRPSSVSAIKVDGKRAYARVRGGEEFELPARPVTVHSFEIVDSRVVESYLDLDVSVSVSSGTYIRALARDLGASLGVGGHLTALRRTSVGTFDIAAAQTLEECETALRLVPLASAAAAAFPNRELDAEGAREISYGRSLPASGTPGVTAVFFEGLCLALMEDRGEVARPLVVFAPAGES